MAIVNRNEILLVCVIFSLLHIGLVLCKGFDVNGEKESNKLRVCIAESRGVYRKAPVHCPILEAKSNIQCVVGSDRLDCLRRISKGQAHFGVFSPEDLVAAQWAGVDVLVTSEMRFNDEPFLYELVAVVANDAHINSVHDVRGSRFCHPGHGLSSHWTDILANYFESTLVARECENDLSPIESRIKASSKFFGTSCKPGPWVPDPIEDANLKKRYSSLCDLCYNPGRCDKTDRYWGRMGSLYCLTSGDGQVAWARLVDVQALFGFSGLQAEADPNLYSYLCLDGHLQPLTTKTPCVWVAQPWPAVAVKREYASTVQLLLEHLNHNDEISWQNALLSLLETYHVNIRQLDTTIPINDYLEQATGLTSAYSFPQCNPPRSIVYCTTSLIAHSKCSWLQEVASVHGIEPNIQCIRENNQDQCMESTQHRASDIVFVDEGDRLRAEHSFGLMPILYEFAKNKSDRYTVVAVVKSTSDIYNFGDLYGKRACLPRFEGAAFLSVLETIRQHRGVLDDMEAYSPQELVEYFDDDSCLWAPNTQKCAAKYAGDDGAIRCLEENHGDVAFVDMGSFQQFISASNNSHSYKLICPFGRTKAANELCYLHWSSRGYLMISNQTSLLRQNEIHNSLREMDRYFGKFYESSVLPFAMYGAYDRQQNIMFHDRTDALRGVQQMNKDRTPRFLEMTITNYSVAMQQHYRNGKSSATLHLVNTIFIMISLMLSHHITISCGSIL